MVTPSFLKMVTTAAGSRALVRLPDGSSTFLRGGSQVQLGDGAVTLKSGEYWLDVPPLERAALVHRAGEVTVSAADTGMSLRLDKDKISVYVARGAMHTPGAIKWTKQILRDAFRVLDTVGAQDRAEQLQMLFSIKD